MGADADLLTSAHWQCASAPPGAFDGPDAAAVAGLDWYDARMPGTVAGSLRDAGAVIPDDLDARDWWFTAEFAAATGARATLDGAGLATIAQVWVNGVLVGESSNMFRALRTPVAELAEHNTIAICFRSLDAVRVPTRPRARWRVARLRTAALRWHRTSLLGRLRGTVPTPAPVGPWRELRLVPSDDTWVTDRMVRARPHADGGGTVEVEAHLTGVAAGTPARVVAGDAHADAALEVDGEHCVVRAQVTLDSVRLWWPRGYGEQPLYDVTLQVDGRELPLGSVGFRTVRVDSAGGGFQFVVNDVPLFVGGACWTPVDPVSLNPDRVALEEAVRTVAEGNLTMLRVSGDTVYESEHFYDLCDRFGIMVWHDAMLAFADPPADEEWRQGVVAETMENIARVAQHPCLAIVSGGSEIAQQAAYAGVALADGLPLLTDGLPSAVASIAPAVPYLPTSPWGGDVPTRPDTGVAHYYGVGAYRRPLDDARRSGVRFAAECLAFAVPPERQTVDEAFGGSAVAGHDPRWKRAVYRDAGASWDFEDIRDHYVRELFGVEPLDVRYSDAERYLDLGRAVLVHLFASTFAEWRRAASPSGGGLVFYLRDALPGAGMGIVDALGRPKAPWYALRRVLAPIAVSVVDEGLNGLVAHVHNSTDAAVTVTLSVDLFVDGELKVDSAESALVVGAFSSVEIGVDALFDGFRDLSWAHRFGPLTYDVISVRLLDRDGREVGSAVHTPGGLARPVERDLGLQAQVSLDDGDALLTVDTRRFAHFVSIDAPGWRPDDSWFHLAPGGSRTIRLRRVDAADAPLRGTVRSLNGGSLHIQGSAS